MCVPLAHRSTELRTVSVSQLFRDSALLVQGLLFQSLGREALESLPPPWFWGWEDRIFPWCLPPGPALYQALCSSFHPLGYCFFSLGSSKHSCFPWTEGERVFLPLFCQLSSTCLLLLVTGVSGPFTHLRFASFLLSVS